MVAACGGASAAELFSECQSVLKLGSYRPLREWLARENIDANYCQRLNDREFIYSTNRNFYFCRLSEKLVCEVHESGSWYPDPIVVKRFSGANGKLFVLFKTQSLGQGIYGQGYQLFYLTPKAVNLRGYSVQSLPLAGVTNGLYSDAGDLCSNMGTGEASIPIDGGFTVANEGNSNLVVFFSQEVTSCATGKKSKRTLKFSWRNGAFEQEQ